MPETITLANNVKKYRERLRINQLDMAERSGLSLEEISLIERCKTDPKLSTLQKLAAYMGIPVSALLEAEE